MIGIQSHRMPTDITLKQYTWDEPCPHTKTGQVITSCFPRFVQHSRHKTEVKRVPFVPGMHVDPSSLAVAADAVTMCEKLGDTDFSFDVIRTDGKNYLIVNPGSRGHTDNLQRLHRMMIFKIHAVLQQLEPLTDVPFQRMDISATSLHYMWPDLKVSSLHFVLDQVLLFSMMAYYHSLRYNQAPNPSVIIPPSLYTVDNTVVFGPVTQIEWILSSECKPSSDISVPTELPANSRAQRAQQYRARQIQLSQRMLSNQTISAHAINHITVAGRERNDNQRCQYCPETSENLDEVCIAHQSLTPYTDRVFFPNGFHHGTSWTDETLRTEGESWLSTRTSQHHHKHRFKRLLLSKGLFPLPPSTTACSVDHIPWSLHYFNWLKFIQSHFGAPGFPILPPTRHRGTWENPVSHRSYLYGDSFLHS